MTVARDELRMVVAWLGTRRRREEYAGAVLSPALPFSLPFHPGGRNKKLQVKLSTEQQQWRILIGDTALPLTEIMGSRLGAGIGAHLESSSNGYPSSWEDRYLNGSRDILHGTEPGIPSILKDRPDSLRKDDDIPAGGGDSNVLFVDALPSDCSRREVSHLFRPFRGFKEIRLVHKEPRHSADKAMVLCFVEFTDSIHALTALEALQGYKFDNKKPDSPALRIQFAHFPFQLSPDDTHIPSQPSPKKAHIPSLPPLDSAQLAVQDEEPVVVKKKLKRGSSKKKEKAEDFKNKQKKFCIKCKQNHFEDCYSSFAISSATVILMNQEDEVDEIKEAPGTKQKQQWLCGFEVSC
ncbi:hypothetical protein E3N88_40935 [Mikania micrantha]|uniref:RRM domain-containing protein n=1 Tax=Mikania micrantha TaxID=192012 RepID=A0A5N6LRD2_9ASTR|nr:hypothetical protein E3N88_40935 [Mikania micrantha]